MDMEEIKNLTNFDGVYVVSDNGAVYMRIDYGGFYEWYEKLDNSFVLLELSVSSKLEESVDNFKSSKKTKVINLGDKR
jgi:hypothetical protein